MEALVRFLKGPRGSQALPGFKKTVHTLEVERLILGGNVMSLKLTSSRGKNVRENVEGILLRAIRSRLRTFGVPSDPEVWILWPDTMAIYQTCM